MFLKIRLLFIKYDVTLWVKNLQNVAHTIFVVSATHVKCFKPKTLLWGQYLKNWYIREIIFGNAKNPSVFYVKCLHISRVLSLSGSK